MSGRSDDALAGYKAVSRLYNGLMTGVVLTLITRKSPDDARRFVFGHFRRQHLEKFLSGLKKLGLDRLPHAVACAQYHYFSNALGGVKTEYMPESDRKAWVRYPPPRWIWQGTAICAVPRVVNEAMLHGWHGHNGVTLGNPRLGFVCTGQTVEGDPGLEGYYCEYDRELAPDERVRFVHNERAPRFDPSCAPRLDSAEWPAERLMKVERSYAMEYVRSMLPTMLELFGAADAKALVGRAARLIGLQFYDDVAALLSVSASDALSFAHLMARLAAAQGEAVDVRQDGSAAIVTQTGWRLMYGITQADVMFPAWNALWEGGLAVHNRDLALSVERRDDVIRWRIAPHT
ncbi:MAG TPA: hypothetical protein VMJ73_15945 [Rhizomicrobium sp.]|nr:hypothetical protein [Rhizomicrobium sp.]